MRYAFIVADGKYIPCIWGYLYISSDALRYHVAILPRESPFHPRVFGRVILSAIAFAPSRPISWFLWWSEEGTRPPRVASRAGDCRLACVYIYIYGVYTGTRIRAGEAIYKAGMEYILPISCVRNGSTSVSVIYRILFVSPSYIPPSSPVIGKNVTQYKVTSERENERARETDRRRAAMDPSWKL